MLLRELSYRMKHIFAIVLGQDSGGHVIRSIGFHNNFLIWIEVNQDRFQSKSLLKFVKSMLTLFCLKELGIFLGERGQRRRKFAVTHDETLIKIGKSKKTLDVFDVSRN